MNQETKKGYVLPNTLDSVNKTDFGWLIEYDGWHFEAVILKDCINKVLKYIYGLEERNEKSKKSK
jgi:hypothetical protein